MEILDLSALELREKIVRREISSKEVISALSERVSRLDGEVRAFLAYHPEAALKQASAVDSRLAGGAPPRLLEGIPVVVKDNICTEGFPCTCGSRLLQDFSPPYRATVVKKISSEGGIVVGKVNMDEFAMGSSCENSGFFPTRNPWDLERVPGGSSGGTAAAISARMGFLGLGSDTGGSVRLPASFCGITGLKPTYGRVSRFGLVAFGSSLDQVGPMTRTVSDCALLLEAIAGKDPLDATSARVRVPAYLDEIEKGVEGVRMGVPREYLAPGLDPEIARPIQKAIEIYEGLGARIREISLPHTPYANATYYLIATSEASSNLARYDGVHYGFRAKKYGGLEEMFSRTRAQGFGKEVKRRIMLGTYSLSAGFFDAYYLKAQKVRRLIAGDFERAFEKVEAILGPTAPVTAFRLGEKIEDPLEMYLCDVLTVGASLSGIPGISIPCGFTRDNLPVGLQILAPPFQEERILRIARAFERVTDFHGKKPPLLLSGR